MSAPAVIVVVRLEERPRVVVDALSDAEAARLYDWLATHPGYSALIDAALELAEERRAASSPTAELTTKQRLAEEALVWFRIAVGLDAELRQAREQLTALVWWVWQHQELHEYAVETIDRRWPTEGA